MRRFNNQPYQLFSVSRHVDRNGKRISPDLAKHDARRKAESLRSRGYNARVVDWVAGSGVFIGRRRYDRTQEEARDKWLKELEQERFESAVFGIGAAGIGVVPRLNAGDNPTDEKWGFRTQLTNPKTKARNPRDPSDVLSELDWNRLEGSIDELLELGFRGNLPSTSKNAGAILANEKAFGTETSMNFGMNNFDGPSGSPGWGLGSMTSEPGQRFGELSTQRRRFHVVASFNDGNDNWGEIPMYAFATQSQAKRFLDALQEDVEERGYLYLPGKEKFAQGTYDLVQLGSEIPIERLELAIVPEYEDLAGETINQTVKVSKAQRGLNLNEEKENMLPRNPSLNDLMKGASNLTRLGEFVEREEEMKEMERSVQCPTGGLGCFCKECVGLERNTPRCNSCFGFDGCLCEV